MRSLQNPLFVAAFQGALPLLQTLLLSGHDVHKKVGLMSSFADSVC